MQQSTSKAMIYILITALAMSVMSALVKVTITQTNVFIILLGRFAISFLWILGLIGRHKLRSESILLKSKKPGLQILRTIFSWSALGLAFYALKLIPLVSATLLGITYPLFVPIIVFFVLGVKTSMKIWMGIAAGFLGVAIILGVHHVHTSVGFVIALMGGLSAACAIVTLRKISSYDHIETSMFYYYSIGFVVSFCFAMHNFHMPDWHVLMLLIAIGVVGTIYQVCFMYALHLAPARTVTPMMYLSVVFSGILGWIFWNYAPNIDFYIGMTIVIVSAIFVLINAKDNQKSTTINNTP